MASTNRNIALAIFLMQVACTPALSAESSFGAADLEVSIAVPPCRTK